MRTNPTRVVSHQNGLWIDRFWGPKGVLHVWTRSHRRYPWYPPIFLSLNSGLLGFPKTFSHNTENMLSLVGLWSFSKCFPIFKHTQKCLLTNPRPFKSNTSQTFDPMGLSSDIFWLEGLGLAEDCHGSKWKHPRKFLGWTAKWLEVRLENHDPRTLQMCLPLENYCIS